MMYQGAFVTNNMSAVTKDTAGPAANAPGEGTQQQNLRLKD
jgi:hypothetical protein